MFFGEFDIPGFDCIDISISMTWLLLPNIFPTEGYKFSKLKKKKKASLGHTKQRIEKDNDQLLPPKIFLLQKCLSSQLLYKPK